MSAATTRALLLAFLAGLSLAPATRAQAPSPTPATAPAAAPAAIDPSRFPPQVRAATEAEAAQVQADSQQAIEAYRRRDLPAFRERANAVLATLDASYGPRHPLRGSLAGGIAAMYSDLGAVEDAATLYDQALDAFVDWPISDPTVRRIAQGAVGALLDGDRPIQGWIRHYPLQVLVAGAVMPLEHGDDLDGATYLDTVAQIATALQRHEEAEVRRREALAIYQRLLPADDVRIGLAQASLADSLAELGQLDEAEKLADLAQANYDRHPDLSPVATAAALRALAKVRALRGRPAEAEALFRRALELRRAALGADHPRTRDAEADLARLLWAEDRQDQARPMFERLLAQAGATGQAGARALRAALDMANTARTPAECGPMAKVMAPAREAMADFTRLDSSPLIMMRLSETYGRLLACAGQPKAAAAAFMEAFNSLMGAQTVRNSSEFSLALARFALVLSDDPETAEEADWFSMQSVGVARSRRRQGLSGTDAPAFGSALDRAVHRVGGGSPLAIAFEADLAANWAQYQRDPSAIAAPTYRHAGFLDAQEVEVSAAALALAQTAARTAAGSGALAELVRQQQNLSAQAVALDRARVAARARGDEARAVSLQSELEALGARLETLDARLTKEFPDYAELVAPSPLALADVQQRLAEDEGLLLLVPSRADVFAFGISRKGIAWHRLAGGRDASAARVDLLRCQVDRANCGGAGAAGVRGVQSVFGAASAQGGRRYDRDAAYALYRDLVAPVESALPGVRRLFVTSTGELASLPLALLLTEAPRAGEDDADPAVLANSDWLADRYALVTLPSVSALRPATAPATEAGSDFLGFGAPALSGATGGSRGGGSLFRTDAEGGRLADVEAVRQLAPLPGSRLELQAMAGLFGDAATVALGDQATETRLKRAPQLAQARVLAFATHGLLPREVRGMDEPGLVFTPPARATALDDGVLTASEASALKLRAEWIILSACNTAAADGSADAGSLSGLAKAFLYAGAESVLASHWRVADDATAFLTTETVALRRSHPELSRAQALQAAMRAVRSGRRGDGSAVPGWTPAWSHPAAWAPFVLISDRDR